MTEVPPYQFETGPGPCIVQSTRTNRSEEGYNKDRRGSIPMVLEESDMTNAREDGREADEKTGTLGNGMTSEQKDGARDSFRSERRSSEGVEADRRTADGKSSKEGHRSRVTPMMP